MMHRAPSTLTKDDVEALVGRARESKTLEFKAQLPGNDRQSKVDFLSGITSLANTAGGDFLMGVSASKGIAVGLVPIAVANLDDEMLRLENILRDSVEPRLPPVQMAAIDCGSATYVFVIRVVRSWVAPHRVMTDNRFYGRNSAGCFPLDVQEVRTSFLLSDSLTERLRAFRNERLMRIMSDEAPVPLEAGGKMVVHAIPLSQFASGANLDIVAQVAAGHVMPLPPGRIGRPNDGRVNLDGLVTVSRSQPASAQVAYCQVFRNGAVEGVQVLPTDGEDGHTYLLRNYEPKVIGTLRNYLMFLEDQSMGFPIFVFLSFVNAANCMLRTPPWPGAESGSAFVENGPLGRDVVALPEVVLPDAVDLPRAMRLTFTTVWNAFGFATSLNYDGTGQWVGGEE